MLVDYIRTNYNQVTCFKSWSDISALHQWASACVWVNQSQVVLQHWTSSRGQGQKTTLHCSAWTESVQPKNNWPSSNWPEHQQNKGQRKDTELHSTAVVKWVDLLKPIKMKEKPWSWGRALLLTHNICWQTWFSNCKDITCVKKNYILPNKREMSDMIRCYLH